MCHGLFKFTRSLYKILEVTNKALMFESFLKLNMWKK